MYITGIHHHQPVIPEHDAEDSDEEDVADVNLAAVKPGFMEQCKLVRTTSPVLSMNL